MQREHPNFRQKKLWSLLAFCTHGLWETCSIVELEDLEDHSYPASIHVLCPYFQDAGLQVLAADGFTYERQALDPLQTASSLRAESGNANRIQLNIFISFNYSNWYGILSYFFHQQYESGLFYPDRPSRSGSRCTTPHPWLVQYWHTGLLA